MLAQTKRSAAVKARQRIQIPLKRVLVSALRTGETDLSNF